jgi:hypothetical protein
MKTLAILFTPALALILGLAAEFFKAVGPHILYLLKTLGG